MRSAKQSETRSTPHLDIGHSVLDIGHSSPSPRLAAWGVLPSEWKPLCAELGIPAFRAAQILNGLYQNFAQSWHDVTTLPTELREILEQRISLTPLRTAAVHDSPDGVQKLLLACPDGACVETVLIPSKGRLTQCISTQVGCNFRCAFCASGQHGRVRNLTADEIVGQVMAGCSQMATSHFSLAETQRRGEDTNENLKSKISNLKSSVTLCASAPLREKNAKPVPLPRPHNIVVMGMGEPFDNYDNVIRALRILNDQKGVNIGARHITVSTCGVVPGIRKFAEEGIQFELSVSLHAPHDALRDRLMPVNRHWPIAGLIATCRDYFDKTKRVVTFEYTLIKNVNDRPHHADELIRLLRGAPCKINLIPLSPVEGFDGQCPEHNTCLAFLDALIKAGFNTTLRKSRGGEVAAACGQLRLRERPITQACLAEHRLPACEH